IPVTLSATWSGAFSMSGVSESEIDHFVMAITSADAIVPHPAAAEMDEQESNLLWLKRKGTLGWKSRRSWRRQMI
ncbi:MAG TPA: hypothetical protein VKD00_10655, partial [Methyloceanibacter sp.]|nr:hypothetical protein [Methyloceanibacter sp.]